MVIKCVFARDITSTCFINTNLIKSEIRKFSFTVEKPYNKTVIDIMIYLPLKVIFTSALGQGNYRFLW